MKIKNYIIITMISLLAGIGRFTVPGRPIKDFSWEITYEALAYVWIGILIGLLFVKEVRWFALGSVVTLILLELVKAAMVPQ